MHLCQSVYFGGSARITNFWIDISAQGHSNNKTLHMSYNIHLSFQCAILCAFAAVTLVGRHLHTQIAFERYCDSNDVKFKHYHSDNCRFVDNVFVEEMKYHHQFLLWNQWPLSKWCGRDMQTGSSRSHMCSNASSKCLLDQGLLTTPTAIQTLMCEYSFEVSAKANW